MEAIRIKMSFSGVRVYITKAIQLQNSYSSFILTLCVSWVQDYSLSHICCRMFRKVRLATEAIDNSDIILAGH